MEAGLGNASSLPDQEKSVLKNLHWYTQEVNPLPILVVAMAIPVTLVAVLVAVVGSLLTILAYSRDPGLRCPHNLFLLHLACCDLALGAVSMPFSLLYAVFALTWPFGKVVCKLFLMIHLTCTTMSVMAVVLAAYDRLIMVNDWYFHLSLSYRTRAKAQLTACWVVAVTLYSPAVGLWDSLLHESLVPDHACAVEFHESPAFVAATQTLGFLIPCTCLVVINSLLIYKLRQRLRICQREEFPLSFLPCLTSEVSCKTEEVFVSNRALLQDRPTQSPRLMAEQRTRLRRYARWCLRMRRKYITQLRGVCRFLAWLVAVLVICWLPYSLTTFLVAFGEERHVHPYLYLFFHWLVGFKSCLNPLLYALKSRRFRRNFKALLKPVGDCLICAYLCTVVLIGVTSASKSNKIKSINNKNNHHHKSSAVSS